MSLIENDCEIYFIKQEHDTYMDRNNSVISLRGQISV